MATSFLIGVRTEEFVVLAADRNVFAHGAVTVKHDHDKSYRLGDKLVMICFGDGGDADQFGEYIAKNLQLYKMRNGYELAPKSVAHYIRRNLAQGLRTADAYLVNLIVGGFDDATGTPYLSAMDYLGTLFENPFLMQGFGGKFGYAIMDGIYRSDWTEEEAVEGIKKCISEVNKRFLVNLSNYQLQVIDQQGVRGLDNIAN